MPSRKNRPRELRRRVIVPARLRHGSSWTDACILNVSSRGLMIHTGRELSHGSEVELRRGDHIAIVARVVWRDGGRAGLHAERRVPVDEIMTLGQAPVLQLRNADGTRAGRRWPCWDARIRARTLEFAGVLAIAATLAAAGVSMFESTFAKPLGHIAKQLGG